MTDARISAAAGPDAASSTRSFWRFWAASATSTTGDGITVVALPLLAITALGASNFEIGLITAANYAAIVLIGLPAGVLVRRFALRGLQVSMDGIRALLILSIPIAAWLHGLTLAHLLAAAFVIGLAGNLFDVANATFIPRVVRPEELTRRNGLLSGTFATTQLVGPSMGGVLVQTVGAAWGLVVDAASYVASALLLSGIPTTGRPPQPPAEGTRFLPQLREGLVFVLRHPVMRPGMLAATTVNFANGALMAVTAPFLVRELALPVGVVGLVVAADGLGSIAGAAATARLADRYGDARVLLGATLIGPLFSILMPFASGPAGVGLFAVGMAGLAAGVTVLSVVARTHRQTESPAELLSRVMASVRFISWSAIPVGALLGGTVAQILGLRAALVIVSAAALLAPVAIWSSRIRRLHRLADS